MADQKRWWKLWCTAPADEELQRIPPAHRWAWAVLGCYTKAHGENGRVVVGEHNIVLAAEMGLSKDEMISVIATMPHVVVQPTPTPGVFDIFWVNWDKYQEDTTVADRMKRYRARRKVVAGMPRSFAESIWKRDGYKCVYCGYDLKADIQAATVDHVIPRSRGGTNESSNLASSCSSCNVTKNEYTPDECDFTIRFGDSETLRNAYRNALNSEEIQPINDEKKSARLRSKRRGEENKKRGEKELLTADTPAAGNGYDSWPAEWEPIKHRIEALQSLTSYREWLADLEWWKTMDELFSSCPKPLSDLLLEAAAYIKTEGYRPRSKRALLLKLRNCMEFSARKAERENQERKRQ